VKRPEFKPQYSPKKKKPQKHKHKPCTGRWHLIILVTQEAAIRRISIPSDPWANSSLDVYQKWEKCQVPVVHGCIPCYSEGRDQENYGSKPAQANSCKTLSQKIELVGCLKVKAPCSSPITTKK
jgi:hypothetical protein